MQKSLIPGIKTAIEGMAVTEQLQYLVNMSRSAFSYQTDESVHGKSKPLAAEELFFYPHSDCEDRSAWFFQMIRHCIDLPAVVIGFSDHVTVGVAIPDFQGDHVLVNGNKFYICDPTGPQGSAEIGRFPLGYEDQPWEILWQE